MSGGSADTKNMGMPANLTVDPVTNEVYVADGYGNRRVIVLDGDTFAFKRMWGAYGNRPDDTDLGPTIPTRRRRSSSGCRTTSPSHATATSTSPTDRTIAFRCSGRTAPT
jgi:DNA-binding beta-propeller fold protein YncE